MDSVIMDGFWSGLAERHRLNKLYGMLCKDCLHDQTISDHVIEQRLDRQHDATCTMRSPYSSSSIPLCDVHRAEWLKSGWTVIREIKKRIDVGARME
jgi:hypothetical protein